MIDRHITKGSSIRDRAMESFHCVSQQSLRRILKWKKIIWLKIKSLQYTTFSAPLIRWGTHGTRQVNFTTEKICWLFHVHETPEVEGGSTNTNKSQLSSGEDDRLRSRCFSAVFVVRASVEKRKGWGQERICLWKSEERCRGWRSEAGKGCPLHPIRSWPHSLPKPLKHHVWALAHSINSCLCSGRVGTSCTRHAAGQRGEWEPPNPTRSHREDSYSLSEDQHTCFCYPQ